MAGPHQTSRSKRQRQSRLIEQHGLTLELDEPPGSSTQLAPDDHAKDGTGVGQVWQAATDLLCEWLESCPQFVLRQRSCLELGAGLGVAGMLVARMGTDVTITDYHPLVLSRLQANVSLNGLDAAASVECLEWGAVIGAERQRFSLIIGADLAFAERSAALLAQTAQEQLSEVGVFVYAHQERRAIFMGSDGEVKREPTDSGLDALLASIAPLQIRQIHTRTTADDERVSLLAIGTLGAIERVPALAHAEERGDGATECSAARHRAMRTRVKTEK